MRFALWMLLACGCAEDMMMTVDRDLGMPGEDLTVVCDGPGGMCQGQSCGAGCKCLVRETTVESDAGSMAGSPVGTCVCAPPGPQDGIWECCAGMYCLTGTTPAPTCNSGSCALP